jgi:ATP-dependent protease HslVU (ClpYQ) peptidase subunit
MIGSLLKIGAALAGLAQDAFAYFRKKDDQNTGRKLQAGDDAKASIDAAKDTRTDEDNVHRLTDDELNKRLRGGS